jgi:hypothetical protein
VHPNQSEEPRVFSLLFAGSPTDALQFGQSVVDFANDAGGEDNITIATAILR